MSLRTRLLSFLSIGLLITVIALCRAPWDVSHPNYPSLIVEERHAPVWSKPGVDGMVVELDKGQLGFEIGAVWIVIAAVESVVQLARKL